jgi:sugar/nucleoside kinase (ribokinase family)
MSSSAWDVVGIGESSVDEVYRLPGTPGPNVKLPISSRQIRYGGQVATALATCASFGLRATLVGTAGDDEHADGLREALASRGVDTSHLIRRSARHRRALVLVNEQTADRVVLWERDPRLSLNAADLPRAVIESARLVHVDAVDEEAAIAAAGIAQSAGIPVTSDIDRMTDWTEALVAAVTVPILAEHIPHMLTGEDRPAAKARRSAACVTRGPARAARRINVPSARAQCSRR